MPNGHISYRWPMKDGTIVALEDEGGTMVHVRLTKGKVHRSIAFTRPEMAALTEIFAERARDLKKEPR
jgi:hypothetical protein